MNHKKLKIGINGFGRIGRAIYRINEKLKIFDIVIINDLNPDINNIVYNLNYDSTYGRLKPKVKKEANKLISNNCHSTIFNKKNISDVPWEDHQVELIIDSSGIKLDLNEVEKLRKKVKNIIVTNAPSNVSHTVILGVNDNQIDPKNNFVISSSICDAISGGPILNLINKKFNVLNGTLITLHPWLGYQRLLDGQSIPYWILHPDTEKVNDQDKHHYALGRSSPMNIIPKSTSAVNAIEKVIPEIRNKIHSHSYRIPTSIVSAATAILNVELETNLVEVKEEIAKFIKNQKFDIIQATSEPLTAVDFLEHEFSATIDHRWTSVNNEKVIKLHYWYDNEWGYSSRVYDLANQILKSY